MTGQKIQELPHARCTNNNVDLKGESGSICVARRGEQLVTFVQGHVKKKEIINK